MAAPPLPDVPKLYDAIIQISQAFQIIEQRIALIPSLAAATDTAGIIDIRNQLQQVLEGIATMRNDVNATNIEVQVDKLTSDVATLKANFETLQEDVKAIHTEKHRIYTLLLQDINSTQAVSRLRQLPVTQGTQYPTVPFPATISALYSMQSAGLNQWLTAYGLPTTGTDEDQAYRLYMHLVTPYDRD